MRFRRSLGALVAPLLVSSLSVLAAAAPAAAVTIDFDNVTAFPKGTVYPGNTWAGKGVTFRSVNSVPNFPLIVGFTVTLSKSQDRVMVISNNASVSEPNFVAASGVFTAGGPNDLLMSFAKPVDSVQVVTDQSKNNEGPDVVRLIALAPTPDPGKFVVVAIASGLDDALTPPADVLSLTLQNPVSFVLFQTTTDGEGFDDLTFTYAPICAQAGAVDHACFEGPLFVDWVPVGCEIADCCELCPGPLDWLIRIDGDPFETLVLRFNDLSPEVAAGLRVEGNATWDAARRRLSVRGPGEVTLHGLALGRDPRWTAASPRMTLQRITAAVREGGGRTVRVRVQQQVGGQAISDSTLVYGF